MDGKPVGFFGVAVMKTFVFPAFNVATSFHSVDGRFELYDVNTGTWDLVVVGPDFARELVIGTNVREDHTVDLGDVTVHRGWTIHGRVTHSDGSPVVNAEVEIDCDPWLAVPDELTARARGCYRGLSGSNGAYVIRNVKKIDPLGNSQRIRASAGNEVSALALVPEQDRTIDITVLRSGRVVGNIVGDVPPDAVVVAHSRHGNNEWGFAVGNPRPDGTFELDRVAPGDYDVAVSLRGHDGATEHIAVRSDQTTSVTVMAPSMLPAPP